MKTLRSFKVKMKLFADYKSTNYQHLNLMEPQNEAKVHMFTCPSLL